MFFRSLIKFARKSHSKMTGQLSEQSVADILKRYGVKRDIDFTGFKMKGELTANNFVSEVSKWEASGVQKESDGEKRAFKGVYRAKELPSDKEYVRLIGCDVAHSNERFAYERILPNLMRYTPRQVVVPEYVGSTENVIVLGDLNALGYTNVNRREMTFQLAKQILQTLASFHAASLIMKHEEPGEFTAISQLVKEVDYDEDSPRFNQIFQSQEDKVQEALLLSDHDFPLKRHMRELVNTVKERVMTLMKTRHDFCVINHGDASLTNILYNEADGDVALLDFQMTRFASLAADLSYFMFVSLDPEFLTSYKDDLLRCYYHHLKEYVSGTPCCDNLTITWLDAEFRDWALFGFIHALWTVPLTMGDVGFQHKVAENLRQFERKSPEEEVGNMNEDVKDAIRKITECYVGIVSPKGALVGGAVSNF